MATLSYKDQDFVDVAFKVVKNQAAFNVVVTGFYAKALKFTVRFPMFRPIVMPSFWAIYTYATDKQLQPTWTANGEDLIVFFKSK
jgi:hypothetical protein